MIRLFFVLLLLLSFGFLSCKARENTALAQTKSVNDGDFKILCDQSTQATDENGDPYNAALKIVFKNNQVRYTAAWNYPEPNRIKGKAKGMFKHESCKRSSMNDIDCSERDSMLKFVIGRGEKYYLDIFTMMHQVFNKENCSTGIPNDMD